LFQINALSHYIISRELDEITNCLIWTSSNTAIRETFDIDDIQGYKSYDPYGSSKYLVQLLSTSLNTNSRKSFICDPGTFNSNITGALIGKWLGYLAMFFFAIIQPLCPKLTIKPELALGALIYVFQNKSELLSDRSKVS
jgi:hypothetical protein